MQMSTRIRIPFLAMAIALIIVLSQITIPLGPVPFTLQTVAIGLIACLFSTKEALLVVGAYLVLGAIGLPVFAGLSGGILHLLGPTAGFLWGFLPFAWLTSSFTWTNTFGRLLVRTFIGDSLCLLTGWVGFGIVTGASWMTAFNTVILPFLIPEILKCLLVALIIRGLHPLLQKTAYFW